MRSVALPNDTIHAVARTQEIEGLRIAGAWQAIAPDHPGFGASSMPAADAFEDSFDALARIMTALIDAKRVERCAAYVMNYGAPVGYRMIAADPERLSAFLIQHGNAYAEGLEAFRAPLRAFWANPSETTAAPRRDFQLLQGTNWLFQTGCRTRRGRAGTTAGMCRTCSTGRANRRGRSRSSSITGAISRSIRNGRRSSASTSRPRCSSGARKTRSSRCPAPPYKRDLEDLEFHLLDTGHFSLEEFAPEIAERIIALKRRLAQ